MTEFIVVLVVVLAALIFLSGLRVFVSSGAAFTRLARKDATRKEFVLRRITDLFENGILTKIVVGKSSVDVYGLYGCMSATSHLDSMSISDAVSETGLKFDHAIVIALSGFSSEEIRYAAECLQRSREFRNEPVAQDEFTLSHHGATA